MNDPLDLPEELRHLIEKRESDNDRRKSNHGREVSQKAESDTLNTTERRKRDRRKDD